VKGNGVVKVKGLACPTCGNADPSDIILFAETIETDRYSYDRTEDGVPVFAFGKSVHTDPGPISPSAECSRCHNMWTPAAGTYELH
jgi:hypothetical protein